MRVVHFLPVLAAALGLDRLQLKDDDLAVLLSKEQLGSLQSWSGE